MILAATYTTMEKQVNILSCIEELGKETLCHRTCLS